MHWTYSWDLNHILPLCVLLYFSEMNNLHSLLLTVVQGAADIPDPQVRVHVRVHVKVLSEFMSKFMSKFKLKDLVILTIRALEIFVYLLVSYLMDVWQQGKKQTNNFNYSTKILQKILRLAYFEDKSLKYI